MRTRKPDSFRHLARFTGWAFLVLQLASPFTASAAGEATPESCPGLFQRFVDKHFPVPTKPNAALLKKLGSTEVGDFFAESEVVLKDPSNPLAGRVFSEKSMAQFHKAFDELLDQRAAVNGINAEKFREWMKTMYGSPYPPFNPDLFFHEIAPAKATLLDLQDSQMAIMRAAKPGSTVAEVLRNLRAEQIAKKTGKVALSLAVGTVTFLAGSLKGAIIAGPIGGIMNSFFSPVVQPTADSMGQVGNIVFAKFAKSVQGVMASFTKWVKNVSEKMSPADKAAMTDLTKAAKEVVNDINTTDFEGKSPEEVKAIMDGLEKRYFNIFQAANKLMAPYLRSGRDLTFDWGAMKPLSIAQSASVFETEYLVAKTKMDSMKKDIGTRAPSPDEAAELASLQKTMATAQKRLAFSVATWDLFSAMYAEVDRGSADTAGISASMRRYKEFLDMGQYKDALGDTIVQAFKAFDPSFTELQHLEGRKK